MKKILVIDDSEANLFLIQSIFENDASIDVHIENDSTKVINDLLENKPDLIVLDLMMPEVDGFQILRIIKEDHPGLVDIPIVVISAHYDMDTLDQIQQYHVKEFFAKPVNLKVIGKKIRDLLYPVTTL